MANEKLYVASMPILGSPSEGFVQHSFIIYDPNSDGDDNPLTFISGTSGEPLILRGGVNSDLGTGSNVIVEAGVRFSASRDANFVALTQTDRNIVELSLPSGQTATSLFNTMVAQTQSMGAPTTVTTDSAQNYQTSIDYFLDQEFVCHSYTSGILAMNGIDLANNLPVNQLSGNSMSISDYKFSDTVFVSGSGNYIVDTFSRIHTIIDTGTGHTTIVVNVSQLDHSGLTLISDKIPGTLDKILLKGIDPADLVFWTYNGSDLWIQDRQGHVIAKLMGQLDTNAKFDGVDIQKPDGTIVPYTLPQNEKEIPPWNPLVPQVTIPACLAPIDGMLGGHGNLVFTHSPLILDLNGDGAHSTKLGWDSDTTPSRTYFDMDNDGFAERTAWVSSGDGLLVMDKNGNDTIDNKGELFGNDTTYANGFLNLKQYDSNNDNVMNASDTQWGNLRVWVDANGDGKTDAGELKTLSSLGITQISLSSTALTSTLDNENTVTDRSTFVMGGVTRNVDDIWFRVDQTSSHYMGNVTLNVETLFLPALKGFGNLKDLHVAMSEDSTLLALVKDFVSTTTTSDFKNNATEIDNKVKAIMYRWAGVDTISPTATTQGLNTQVITFLEKLTGYKTSYLDGIPANQNASDPSGAHNEMVRHALQNIKAQLLVQLFGSELFENTGYNLATGELTETPVLSTAGFAKIAADLNGLTTAEKSSYWTGLNTFLLTLKDFTTFTAAEQTGLNAVWNNMNGYTWANTISGGSYIRPEWSFSGTALSDYLIGPDNASNTIHGSGGDDYIQGGHQVNWLLVNPHY